MTRSAGGRRACPGVGAPGRAARLRRAHPGARRPAAGPPPRRSTDARPRTRGDAGGRRCRAAVEPARSRWPAQRSGSRHRGLVGSAAGGGCCVVVVGGWPGRSSGSSWRRSNQWPSGVRQPGRAAHRGAPTTDASRVLESRAVGAACVTSSRCTNGARSRGTSRRPARPPCGRWWVRSCWSASCCCWCAGSCGLTGRSVARLRFFVAARVAGGGLRALPLVVVVVAVAQLVLGTSLAGDPAARPGVGCPARRRR